MTSGTPDEVLDGELDRLHGGLAGRSACPDAPSTSRTPTEDETGGGPPAAPARRPVQGAAGPVTAPP